MDLSELAAVSIEDADALANVLQKLRQRLGNGDSEAVLEAVAKRLGRPKDWVRTLYTLSGPDFRRALRSKPQQHERTAGEIIYPKTGWLGD